MSANTVGETDPVGTVIGDLSTDDPDLVDQHTYSLVSGPGDANNSQYELIGSSLRLATPLSVVQDVAHTVRIRSVDLEGALVEKIFSILVSNFNTPPRDIYLSANAVSETAPLGTVIGDFSTDDPDVGDYHTYSLVSGTGDTDNFFYSIHLGSLRLGDYLFVNSDVTHSIRVRLVDLAGASVEKVFNVEVSNANASQEIFP